MHSVVSMSIPGWDWLEKTSSGVTPWLAVACLVVGASIAITPWLWRKTRLLATWVHEASHALAAVITRRKVTSMKVNSDASGVTGHVGKEFGFGRMFTTFAGYPGPALVGLALCLSVSAQHTNWTIAGFLIVSLFLLPKQRSLRGLGLTVLIGALAALVVFFSFSTLVVSYLILVLAGYMLAASPRTVVELHGVRRFQKSQKASGGPTNELQHSDADALARQTFIPAIVWETVFFAASLVCAWYAVSALL